MEERQFFNEMPRPTFRWLRVNHYESKVLDIQNRGSSTVTLSGDTDVVKDLLTKDLLKADYDGVNPEVLEIVKDHYREGYFIEVPKGMHKAVVIESHLTDESPWDALRLLIHAKEGASLSLHILFDSNDDQLEGVQHLLTEIIAEKNASVSVKKVQTFGHKIQHFEHRYSQIDESATVEFLNVEVGGKENLYNFDTHLNGKKAHLTHDFAYLGDKEQRFDINMLMTHQGKKSTSEIHSLGAITDQSVKAFRGTLDFLKGCTGSEGSEEDTCLLLNDRVKSISVPLLLCKEDDVVGNHAASAGQMDPNKLFYLMSRGFSENEAKHLLVESMLRPIVDKVGIPEVEERALDFIRHKI